MKKPILKKSNYKMFLGVCAGIAEYTAWIPKQVRILFFVITLLGGSGIIAYIVLALIMPNADANDSGSFNIDEFRKD